MQETLADHDDPRNRVTPAHSPTMPFGKFKGTPLAELSDDYLLWLGCLDDLRQPLLGAVLREMSRRLAARPAAAGMAA